MPYIPITEKEREEMLKIIGKGIEELFSVIPEKSRPDKLPDFPGGLSEIELRSYFKKLASRNKPLVPFVGLGVYDHYIPSVPIFPSTLSHSWSSEYFKFSGMFISPPICALRFCKRVASQSHP